MRRALRNEDFAALAAALRSPERPPPVFRLIETLSAEVIGHRLFTIMRLHASSQEVERHYSSRPDAYPVSGR